MKLYIAAPFGMRATVAKYAKQVEALGHEVVGRWFEEEPAGGSDGALGWGSEEYARRAQRDLRDVGTANYFVLLAGLSTTGGKHVETGWALARGKRVAIVGELENVFHSLIPEQYSSWDDFTSNLKMTPTNEGVLFEPAWSKK